MKVLAIGNSFSQDATRYLHGIAATMPVKMKVVNLYIGGCSLRTHYLNMLEDRKNYMMEFNGVATGVMVSIKDALISDDWDVITLQQVSGNSVNYDTFQPYLNALAEYVRKYSPRSKLYIHQTWAYEEGSQRLCVEKGYAKEADMLADAVASYDKAAEAIGADGIIPSGLVMYALHQRIPAVHRDTFHASWGAGRFALALNWYRCLTDGDISDVKFNGFDVPVTEEEYKAAIDAVNEVLK